MCSPQKPLTSSARADIALTRQLQQDYSAVHAYATETIDAVGTNRDSIHKAMTVTAGQRRSTHSARNGIEPDGWAGTWAWRTAELSAGALVACQRKGMSRAEEGDEWGQICKGRGGRVEGGVVGTGVDAVDCSNKCTVIL